jgi:predicted secreted Zn-dependent protease
MRRPATLLCVAASVVGCASAPRSGGPARRPLLPYGVRVARSLTEYTVEAGSFGEALRRARETGPEISGERLPGATSWNVRWMYRYERGTGGCSLRDVRADVQVRVQIPRWTHPPQADSAEVAVWAAFRSRLDSHEEGHVNIGVDAGAEIVPALTDLVGGSCEGLGMRANTLGQDILARSQARNREYDRVTRHGARAAADTVAGRNNRTFRRVGVVPGGGGSTHYLAAAVAAGCDTFLTGEGSLYTELFAFECGLTLVYATHTATEFPAICAFVASVAEALGLFSVNLPETASITGGGRAPLEYGRTRPLQHPDGAAQ